jgi:hypothetical protein
MLGAAPLPPRPEPSSIAALPALPVDGMESPLGAGEFAARLFAAGFRAVELFDALPGLSTSLPLLPQLIVMPPSTAIAVNHAQSCFMDMSFASTRKWAYDRDENGREVSTHRTWTIGRAVVGPKSNA